MSRLHSLSFALICATGLAHAAPADFIPVQTPYLLARSGPAGTGSVLDRELLLASIGGLSELLGTGPMPADQAETQARAPLTPMMQKLVDELAKLGRAEQWGLLGLKLDGQMALYGRGMLPVLRIELADAAKFELFVAALEAANESPLRQLELADGQAWVLTSPPSTTAGGEGKPVPALLLGIQDGAMVASFAAETATDAELQTQLGKGGPTLGSAGLKALLQRYGLGQAGIALLDSPRLLAQTLHPTDTADRSFRDAFALKADEEMPPLCQLEALALAAQVPKIVWGIGSGSAQMLKTRLIVELESAFAGELSRASREGPRLSPNGHFVDFASALDVRQLVGSLQTRARAAAAAPWVCPEFTDFNDAASALANQEMLAFVDPWLDLLSLRLELPGIEESDWNTGFLSLEARDPMALFQWVSTWQPELAQLKVSTDGTPFVVQEDATGRYLMAIDGQRLSLAGGADAEQRLRAAGNLPRSTDAPALSFWFGPSLLQQAGGDIGAEAGLLDFGTRLQQMLRGVLLETRLTTRGVETDVRLELKP